ncbi:MAG: carboxylesterase family protein [archaeon]|nr:carboxylesterase family protein [archaeon]
MDVKKYVTLKNLSFTLAALTGISIIFGIIYVVLPVYNILWDIFGAIYLFTLFYSILFTFFISKKLNKANQLGNKLNILTYFYPIIIFIAMPVMGFGNLFNSTTYSPSLLANFGFYLMIYCSFFGSLGFILLFSYFIIKNLGNDEIWIQNRTENELGISNSTKRSKKIIRIIARIVCSIFLLILFYFSIILMGQADLLYNLSSLNPVLGMIGYPAWMLEMIIPELSLYFVFMSLSITVLFLKTVDMRKRKEVFYAISIIGVIITTGCLFPFLGTPIAITDSEINFAEAFGNDWEDRIDANAAEYFLKTPFSTPQFFLGIRTTNYDYLENQTYFVGSDSNETIDENITLCYDVFMPKNGGKDSLGNWLPGHNSTLICIHGGSWRSYDKGFTNAMHNHKYLASQGYIVFDIQHGLLRPDGEGAFLTPKHVCGNFTITDMIRHIGNFTHYLTENAANFGANLSSVFFSGGSSGGHLASASALAIASGNYTQYFSTNLTIKGLIPYCPGLGLPTDLGPLELIRPSYLINESSPPCLLYQGMNDGYVPYTTSMGFKNAYDINGSGNCAVVYLPFAGHMNHLFAFQSNLNLVFLYYMERFMYLHR